MSDSGFIGGQTWAGLKRSLNGPPPGHKNRQIAEGETYIPLYQQQAAAIRREEKDPFEA